MQTSMSLVQIPTNNATLCNIVRGVLTSTYNFSVSGWTPLTNIECYFRLSAQIYLEQSDFIALGDAVLDIIANASSPSKK